MVISRDVNFDESVLGTGPSLTYEEVEDLDLESLVLADDDLRPMQFSRPASVKVGRIMMKTRIADLVWCAHDPDWKKQVRRTTILRGELMKMKKKSRKNNMMCRLLLRFGMRVQMSMKQQWICRNHRRLKKQ